MTTSYSTPPAFTDRDLLDLLDTVRQESVAAADARARRSAAVLAWWRSQPDTVQRSEEGQLVLDLAANGHFIHPVAYDRLAAAIHRLGGVMP